jgi:hypothetical protein
MSYVLTDGSNNIVTYPYSIGLLRRDNPSVSFPASPTDEQIADWNVFPVTEEAQPSIDTLTEYITEGTPIFVTDHWEQTWVVNTYTPSEEANILNQFQQNAANEAAGRFEATNKYITQALTEGLELTPELIAYRTALMDPAALTGYPNNITWPTEPTSYFVGAGATKVVSLDVENVVVSGTMTIGSTPIDTGSVVTKDYVDDAIANLVNSSTPALDTLNELALALGNDANFATTVTNQIALKANSADVYTKAEVNTAISTAVSPKANTADVYTKTDVFTKAETTTAISAATSGLALSNKVLNLQAPVSPSTTPVIAPALATIGTTNGYVLNLSFGNFDEVGPIVFNEKWQLQVDGPPSAGTTAVTIKNGITIQNSNGVRLTRVQIEGTSSISCRAGLGFYFEKTQFMGPLTLGGTGGFMMFTDCDFAGNVTISPTFAGTVYFIRCAFSGASATYTFGQPSSLQAIVLDSSGIPNAGFVSGATPKASYSGMMTYKNGFQAFFVNNIPVSTAGAASGQVLKYNGTTFAPAADNATDATKLPLAGGTMTGAIAMSNNKVTGLGTPTSDGDATTKAYVDLKNRWTLMADVNSTSTVPLPAGFNTVIDLMLGSIEFMLVTRTGNEYVSSVNPVQGIVAYPATFPVHKGGTHIASFTFNSSTDTTFDITVNSATQVKMFYR